MPQYLNHTRFQLIILVSLLFGLISITARADEDDTDDEISIATATVELDKNIQISSGLKTVTLTTSNYQPEILAYGKGLSWLPLLKLRSQYFTQLAELSLTETSYQQTKQELARQQQLFHAKALAKKKLQYQQSLLQSLHARILAERIQLKHIRATALLAWGEKLANLVIDPKSEQLDRWLDNGDTLLRINLPENDDALHDIGAIHVFKSAHRNQAVPAILLAPAPAQTAAQQLTGYFFISRDPSIQAMMRIIAWIPKGQQQHSGVMIPDSAIIRYLNQSFVYIKTDEKTFKRQAVHDLVRIDQNYFIPESLKAGDTLVINGAQMLWSEEFRSRIPDEDDD